MPEEKSCLPAGRHGLPDAGHGRHSLQLTSQNVTAIDYDLTHGIIAKKDACVIFSYSIMLDISVRLKEKTISNEIPKRVKSLNKTVGLSSYDDLWRFEETLGLIYEIDELQNCVRIITEDGHCIEVDVSVFLELERRYLAGERRVKKRITTL